jgi:hypothetical protein
MGTFYSPIDFSGIVGYPHDVPEIVIENLPDFRNYGDACARIRAFGQCIDEWCHPPIYEDVLMQLFAMTLCEEDAYYWFHHSDDNKFKTIQDLMHAFLEQWGDDQIEISNELVDAFMKKRKEKNLPDMGTVHSDVKIDTSPDSIEELKEINETMQFSHAEQFEAMEDQLEIMEANLDNTHACIEYPNPIELELHSEQEREVHREISDESIDEPIIDLEIKEFEFEVVEYIDNSSPHPPPEEPISLRENFDNLDESSAVVPWTCSFPTSQPTDELIQDNGRMEGNLSLSNLYHYEQWLTFRHDGHKQQGIKILHNLSNSNVWLNRGRCMILGRFFLTRNSQLIMLEFKLLLGFFSIY